MLPWMRRESCPFFPIDLLQDWPPNIKGAQIYGGRELAELSRYRAVIESGPRFLGSGNRARHGFPMRHCADAVNVRGQGGTFVMRDYEEISQSREDRDEALQATR